MTAPLARRNNRYQTKPNGEYDAPSVTTVLQMLHKPGLGWGAAKETAILAVQNRDAWQNLPEDRALHKLRNHHRKLWDKKAERGTMVHSLAQEWAEGKAVEVPAECSGYMDALERFYYDWEPNWLEVESAVIHDDPETSYGGSFDGLGILADQRSYLIDIKTSEKCWPSMCLQLAAYQYADAIGVYDDTGNLIGKRKLPHVDRSALLHLKGDGTYDLVPVLTSLEVFDTFLNCRRVWEWWNHAESHPEDSLDEPLVPPKKRPRPSYPPNIAALVD